METLPVSPAWWTVFALSSLCMFYSFPLRGAIEPKRLDRLPIDFWFNHGKIRGKEQGHSRKRLAQKINGFSSRKRLTQKIDGFRKRPSTSFRSNWANLGTVLGVILKQNQEKTAYPENGPILEQIPALCWSKLGPF